MDSYPHQDPEQDPPQGQQAPAPPVWAPAAPAPTWGTGMVLTSSGEVLTNNHVVSGATSIKVTAVTTGRTYTAKIVGTDPADDVAVLQLQGASGLKTIGTADSSKLAVGTAVVALGNA